MEMLYALQKFDAPENCLFFIRNGIKPSDIFSEEKRKIYFPTDEGLSLKCKALKNHLYKNYPNNTFDYNCYWDNETESIKGLESLGEMVIEKITELIYKEFSNELSSENTILYREKLLQTAILLDAQENTYGRKNEINRIISFIENSTKQELLISATSGLGKSSLLASFCKEYNDKALIIPFFAGASKNSYDFKFLARYLYSVLINSNDDGVLDLPYKEVKKLLLGALIDASNERSVIICIDALDQFSPCLELFKLDFLNEQLLPSNVKIVYTALPEFIGYLEKRSAEIFNLNTLSLTDIKSVAVGVSNKLHKELNENTLKLLTEKYLENGELACSTPIYLILLINLLCSFDSNDFANIVKSEKEKNLSPAVAIQKYVEETVLRAGNSSKDVINSIASKTINELGEKYDIITALLVSSDNGISEDEVTGISDILGANVSVADFSIYRRMFRLHLIESENGKCKFSHAVIKNALIEYANNLNLDSLYNAAVTYYDSLIGNDNEKYGGLTLFLGKLGKYEEIFNLPLLSELATDELINVLLNNNASEVLSYCPKNKLFYFAFNVYLNLTRSFTANSDKFLNLGVDVINALLSADYKTDSNAKILSKYYIYCANLLIESGNDKARPFFEIALNVLIKSGSDNVTIIKTAYDISRIFYLRNDISIAENYAYTAYKYAKKLKENELDNDNLKLYATILTHLNDCIEENPLSLRKPFRKRYLLFAKSVATKLNDVNLITKCNLEIINLSKLTISKKEKDTAISEVLTTNDDCLSNSVYFEKELYLSTIENAEVHCKNAYDKSIITLQQNSDKNAMILYGRALEEYLYRLMLGGNSNFETVYNLWRKTDKIFSKIRLVFVDITYKNKRLSLINDFKVYAKSVNQTFNYEDAEKDILNRTKKELKSKSSDFVRKKDLYTKIAVVLGILGFIAYALVQFIGFEFSVHDSYFLKQVSLLGRNITEAFTNILLAVILFYAVLLNYSIEKKTYNYEVDHKRFLTLIFIAVITFSISCVFDSFHISLSTNPTNFELKYLESLRGLVLSITFAGSIIWFISYAFGVIISNPYASSVQNEFIFKFRRKEIIYRLIKQTAFTIIFILAFIPFAFSSPYSANKSIDMFGTTPKIYLNYCYIPLILQVILSVLEFIILKNKFKGNAYNIKYSSPKVRGKVNLFKVIIAGVCLTVIFTFNFISKTAFKNKLFNEYGYTTTISYAYEINDNEVSIRQYLGNSVNVTIPEKIDGKPVTKIKESAFRKTKVESVILPSKVNEVQAYAFAECENLVSVTTKSKDYIKFNHLTFEDSKINFIDSVLDKGYYMVGNNLALVNTYAIKGVVKIPYGVKVIEESFFNYSTKMTELHLPDTIEKISANSLSQCTALYYIKLPKSLKTIEKAFYGCAKLYFIDNFSNIDITSGDDTYKDLVSRAIKITTDGTALSDKVGDFVFYYDKTNKIYTLAGIDESKRLITLPSDYKGSPYLISYYLLTNRTNVLNLIIPNGYSFYQLNGISTFYTYGYDNYDVKLIDGVYYYVDESNKKVLILSTDKRFEDFEIKAIQGYENYDYVISRFGFYGNQTIKNLTISVDCEIEKYCFAYNCNLTNLIINANVKAINNSFDSCIRLKNVTIKNGNLEKEVYAFKNCPLIDD